MRSSRRSRRPSPISCRGSVTRLGACPSAPPPRARRRARSPSTRRSSASSRVSGHWSPCQRSCSTRSGPCSPRTSPPIATCRRPPTQRWIATPCVVRGATGSAVARLDAPLRPGQIRDANRYSLASAVSAMGLEPVVLGIVRDTADDLRHALRAAAAQADVIVTSGGVSVGDHDHVKPGVDELGSLDFLSIAIRPGRPLAFGEIDGRLIFGLPGNPVSSLLGFELFVRPALLKMAGRPLLHRPRVTATLNDTLDTPPGLRFFAPPVYDPASGTVRTTGPQGSGILRSMALANSFIDVPETIQHLDRGAQVTVIRTDQPEDH